MSLVSPRMFTNKPQTVKLAAAGNAQNVRHLRRNPASQPSQKSPSANKIDFFAIPESTNRWNWKTVLEPSANRSGRPWRRWCSTVTACAKWLAAGSISVGHAHQRRRLHLQIRALLAPDGTARPPVRRPRPLHVHRRAVFLHTLSPTQHAPVACIVGCLPGQGLLLHNRPHRGSTSDERTTQLAPYIIMLLALLDENVIKISTSSHT